MVNSLKVIMAITKKELIEVIRYKDWIAGMFIFPILFPLFYVLGAVGLSGPSGSGMERFKEISGFSNVTGFIIIGTIVYMWVNLTMWNLGTYLRMEQQKGTLETLWVCPIKKFNILLGGGCLNIILSIFYVSISIIESRIFYQVNFTGNMFEWIFIFLVLCPGVYGLGLIFASLVLWLKEANVAVMLVRGLVMIFCGLSYPIIVMPMWMQSISTIFPFTFGIQAARDIMLNDVSIYGARKDLLICLGLGVLYFIIGRLIFVLVEKKVRENGSLERF